MNFHVRCSGLLEYLADVCHYQIQSLLSADHGVVGIAFWGFGVYSLKFQGRFIERERERESETVKKEGKKETVKKQDNCFADIWHSCKEAQQYQVPIAIQASVLSKHVFPVEAVSFTDMS